MGVCELYPFCPRFQINAVSYETFGGGRPISRSEALALIPTPVYFIDAVDG